MMKKIANDDRIVININDASAFTPFLVDGKPSAGESVVHIDENYPQGAGFHVYRMAPGTTTTAHEHLCDEQFLMLDGDLTDNDGFEYGPGDLVLLKKGTQHNSTTRKGCTLAVFIAVPEENLV